MSSTETYLHWLDTEIDVTADDLREQAGASLSDAAVRLVDLMTAKTVLREFIASQTPNTPDNLTE
ncbi:MAG: hypothetical protein K2Q11_11460 [Burkholderiaceae bacterium]|nr:hypothetical protein [Burkholderiaceae bacterium]